MPDTNLARFDSLTARQIIQVWVAGIPAWLQNLVGVSLEVIGRRRTNLLTNAFGEISRVQADRLFVVLPMGNGSPKGRVLSRWPVAAKIALANAGATGGAPTSPTPPSG